jgi:predicted RNA binding protein YcfA (HicA-like mRNA interferase family)
LLPEPGVLPRRGRRVSGTDATEITLQDIRVKFRELVRMIEDDGWRLVVQRGSHRQYEHPRKAGKVTVAGKPTEVPKGTAANILRQAGLRRSST